VVKPKTSASRTTKTKSATSSAVKTKKPTTSMVKAKTAAPKAVESKPQTPSVIKTKSAFPVFVVKDLEAAKKFYLAHFDFKVAFESKWYIHLFSEAGVQIAFSIIDASAQPLILRNPYHINSGVAFSIDVENADDAYAVAKAKSLNIVFNLRSEDWGQRHFYIKDPNGLYVEVSQDIEPKPETIIDRVVIWFMEKFGMI